MNPIGSSVDGLTCLDALDLGGGRWAAVVRDDEGTRALPIVATGVAWRPARAGDGAAEALVRLLVADPGTVGRFDVTSWQARPVTGETAVTVDQTNQSVVVGEAAVVKWSTSADTAVSPAPERIAALRDGGFTDMPEPWGHVRWRGELGPILVATVDAYLPGAVDGWTWAVDAVVAAAGGDHRPAIEPATQVGRIVANLHLSLRGVASTASAEDGRRWAREALATLTEAESLATGATADLLRDHHDDVVTALSGLARTEGTAVLPGHGDLHVGQVLRAGDRFVITDFDGNPVVPATERALPIPAALDVAGLAQSLNHASIVARRHHPTLPRQATVDVDRAMRAAFFAAYTTRLIEAEATALVDASLVPALRLQQVLREIVYAARHLPRWMYVPDAALVDLIDEGEL